MGKQASTRNGEIVCIGEVLWDVFPSGMFLGGAPFNAACDLQQLGLQATMVSRVGSDELGARVIEAMRSRGMTTEFMQIDRALPTGIVQVDIDTRGVPHYSINNPAAWDAIELPGGVFSGARDESSILVFGSLAQRSPTSRSTIEALCERFAVRIFDVNLRAPYDDQDVVRASLLKSTILKLNRHEADQIAEWFGLPQFSSSSSVAGPEFCAAIHQKFGCETVCITKDADGAALWHQGQWSEHPGFKIDVKDPVGAGDAFLAGFISSFAAKKTWHETLEFSNLLGAYVAQSSGATPLFSADALQTFHRRSAERR